MATVQSIIDRVTYITGDYDHVRWSLAELVDWANDAAGLIAEVPGSRASSQYVTLALTPGARQDLRVLDPSKRWIRLLELVCNVVGGEPIGRTIRQITRPILDAASPKWRSQTPAVEISEYAIDERNQHLFDVIPPAREGATVYALAAVKPARFGVLSGDGATLADAAELFPLPGYDMPAVDFILWRCFSKDANAPAYSARAAGHLQAFQAGVGIEAKDTAP